MTRTLLVLASAVMFAGCADPYEGRPAAGAVPGEEPAPPVRHAEGPADVAAATPQRLMRRAAELPSTPAGHRQRARMSIGPARAEALTAAASSMGDTSRTAAGTFVGAVRDRHRGRYLVVVRVYRSYRVITAVAARVRAGWVLRRWTPHP